MSARGSCSWHALAAGAALFAVLSCARTPDPSLDLMLAAPVCDTTPMQPLGRAVRIPPVTPSPTGGALTGIVYQRETGDALAGAAVGIVAAADTSSDHYSERYTDDNGGFAFDNVAPGRYRVRIRRISEYRDSASYEAVSGRVDTMRVAMRAYRCSGY